MPRCNIWENLHVATELVLSLARNWKCSHQIGVYGHID